MDDTQNWLPIRTGIVGTGYIAEFHALGIRAMKGTELVAVCDPNIKSAQSFASTWRVSATYDSLESMLHAQRLDCVHILTPPDSHHPLARIALEMGAHVLLEKPLCVSVEQADDLCKFAHNARRQLGVGHNMLYAAPYKRLRELVHSGTLGPIDFVTINHFVELPQIRVGPFDSWMLRSPGNVFLEIGPHLVSALLDLVGAPDRIAVTVNNSIKLPGGGHTFSRWHIRAAVGRTAVDINVNLAPGFPQRVISVRGLNGSATLDFDANTCTVDYRTPLSIDLDRYKRSRLLANQIKVQARQTVNDYILSKLKVRKRGNPYQVTFIDSVAAFYSALRSNASLDSRINCSSGRNVIEWCTRIVREAALERAIGPESRPRSKLAIKPTVLVLGGTGFIGRELIRQLLAANYSVRVAVRGSGAVLEEFDRNRLEIVRVDLHSETELKGAMEGIQFVYHLALANVKSWEDNLRHNVETTRLVGEACLAAGVRRLVFTGTIDSYYAGGKAGAITEQTPLDPNIGRRNNYARAKAAAERILLDMHRTKQLPLVIFRPGIVIGRGGNPFHYGVGAWASEGVCQVWGDGTNKLPFVLVEDVAAALVRGIQTADIEGRSYNLVDDPLLTARDYLNELQRRSGMNIRVYYRPIWRLFLNDLGKWVVKLAVRHPDRSRIPSYFDWESRTQKAYFDNTRARADLGWKPASDRQRLLDEGVGGSLGSWMQFIDSELAHRSNYAFVQDRDVRQ